MTEYKDQGLKKAAKQSKTPQLPSNFTYRMMKRIGEEMYLREKRQEKRLFILMIITVMLMTGGCLGMIIWMYGKEISEGLHASVNNLPVNPEKPDVPLNKNDAFQKVQKRRVQEKR